MSLGQNMIYYRKKNNLTQTEVAEKLGVSVTAVSKYELDLRSPKPNSLLRLSDLFHITVDELLRGNNVKND